VRANHDGRTGKARTASERRRQVGALAVRPSETTGRGVCRQKVGL
jgi:hypothetical protein